MISPTLERELHEHFSHLAIEQERQVINFARALAASRPRGVPGHTLLQFVGTIAADDLARMARAIAADCEQINPNDW
jgi:hypothetical protein